MTELNHPLVVGSKVQVANPQGQQSIAPVSQARTSGATPEAQVRADSRSLLSWLPSNIFGSSLSRYRPKASDAIPAGMPVPPPLSASAKLQALQLRAQNPREVINNHQILTSLDSDPKAQHASWQAVLQILQTQGFVQVDENIMRMTEAKNMTGVKNSAVTLPWTHLKTYSAFQKYLRSSGITQTGRVPDLLTALKVAHNNNHLKDMGRTKPIALVVGSVEDHNGAFTAVNGHHILQTLNTQGYDVVYVEANTDKAAMAQIKRIHQVTGRKMSTLVFAGHGTSQDLQLGAPGKMSQVEDAFIDVDDFAVQGDFNGLDKMVASNGQVLLWACSNADPRLKHNLHHTVATQLPGRDIFGAKMDSNIQRITFKKQRIHWVHWYGEAGHKINLSPATVKAERPAQLKWISQRRDILKDQAREQMAEPAVLQPNGS